jgi:hypothetical protein
MDSGWLDLTLMSAHLLYLVLKINISIMILMGDGNISRLHSFLLYQYLSSTSLTFISTSSLYLKQLCTVDVVYYSMTKSYDSTIRLSCIKRRLECQCGTINSLCVLSGI